MKTTATSSNSLVVWGIRVTVVLCALLVLFVGWKVLADTQPNLGHNNTAGQMYYAISRSQYTLATQNVVGVYFPANATGNHTITINRAARSGGADFRFNILVEGSATVSSNSSDIESTVSRTVNLNNVEVDPNTGRKRVLVTVRQTSTNANGFFRFSVSSSNGLVRPVGSDLTSYDTITGRADLDDFRNYTINFGSDCTIPAGGQWKTIRLLDPDNYVNGAWHGDPSAQGSNRRIVNGSVVYTGQTMRVYVQKAQVGSTNFTNLTASEYQRGNHVSSSGSGTNYRILPMGAESMAGRERASTFNIRMNPGQIYRLHITNMKTNNSIQIQLPTDSIYYDTGCASWGVSGESSVSQTTAAPGDTVTWEHEITNDGPNVLSQDVTSLIRRSDGWSGDFSSSTGGRGTAKDGSIRTVTRNYRITDDDVGRTLCEAIRWTPSSSSNSAASSSTAACVEVPYSYDVIPRVSLNNTQVDVGATSISGIGASMNNNGATKSEEGIYFLSRFVVRASNAMTLPTTHTSGVAIPYAPGSGALVSNWGCYIPTTVMGGTDCAGLDVNGNYAERDRGLTTIAPSGRFNGTDDALPDNLGVGDRVCYVLGMTRYERGAGGTLDANLFRYSAPACATVAKSPQVQFWGADVRSSGQVLTSRSPVGTNFVGSWGEYGILSQDVVNSASGAGLSSGEDGRSVGAPITYNRLTFANTPNFGSFGVISRTSLPNYFMDTSGTRPWSAAPKSSGGHATVEDLASPSERVVKWQAPGNVIIRGGTVPAGKTIIVQVSGTVWIEGDIRYHEGPYTSVAQLPQMIIVADRIIMNQWNNQPESVHATHVDAWLIARNYVSTCNTVNNPGQWLSGLNATTCDKQLRVNGPIVSEHLYLRRTYGADDGSRAVPAEVLNLRPDAYLWGYGYSRDPSAISTMYTRELPPRF